MFIYLENEAKIIQRFNIQSLIKLYRITHKIILILYILLIIIILSTKRS